jgi:hypothetical protein
LVGDALRPTVPDQPQYERAIGTLLVLFHAFRNWSTAGRWIWSKLFDVALAFACVGFTWFIWHWNLINFNLHY